MLATGSAKDLRPGQQSELNLDAEPLIGRQRELFCPSGSFESAM